LYGFVDLLYITALWLDSLAYLHESVSDKTAPMKLIGPGKIYPNTITWQYLFSKRIDFIL